MNSFFSTTRIAAACLAVAVVVGCDKGHNPTAAQPVGTAPNTTSMTPGQARAEFLLNEQMGNPTAAQPAAKQAAVTAGPDTSSSAIPYSALSLFFYAQLGNLEVVKLLLASPGLDVETKNPVDDFTVLHTAATYGHLELVKYLVGQGATVDATGKNGETPLLWAAWNGHLEVVNYLVEQGANILAYTRVGAIRKLAQEEGHTSVVTYIEGRARKELTRRGIAYTAEAFVDSAGARNWEVVQLFVQSGMSIDATGTGGRTALHWAAYWGPLETLEIVKYLVGQGASVTATDNRDNTTLIYAVGYYGNLEVVKYLVGQGVSVTARSYDGETALNRAARLGNLEVVKYLVGQGASLTATDRLGYTALQNAVQGGYLEIVKYLVEQGASLTGTYTGGLTVLHWAARDGNLAMVKYLVEQGASLTATTNSGETAKGLASLNGRTAVVTYLNSVGG